MTKAELIDRIARNKDLPPEVTKKIITKVLDTAFAELSGYFVRTRVSRSSNPRFTYPKFGTFTKKKRSGRRGVNPRTLEPIEIEACETVDFRPSVELKRQLNEAASTRTAGTRPTAATKPRKKKAARSSSKRKANEGAKHEIKARAAGPGGRKLVTREEADLELTAEPLLPDARLAKVGAKGVGAKAKVGRRGRSNEIDLEGTGS
jgi:nucleoid DNA-binding protein